MVWSRYQEAISLFACWFCRSCITGLHWWSPGIPAGDQNNHFPLAYSPVFIFLSCQWQGFLFCAPHKLRKLTFFFGILAVVISTLFLHFFESLLFHVGKPPNFWVPKPDWTPSDFSISSFPSTSICLQSPFVHFLPNREGWIGWFAEPLDFTGFFGYSSLRILGCSTHFQRFWSAWILVWVRVDSSLRGV